MIEQHPANNSFVDVEVAVVPVFGAVELVPLEVAVLSTEVKGVSYTAIVPPAPELVPLRVTVAVVPGDDPADKQYHTSVVPEDATVDCIALVHVQFV
jgi:hypothetical protein